MTFDSNESGIETGQPIELYEFRLGADDPTRLTSSENTVEIISTGEVYDPETIKRGALVQENGAPAMRLEIRMQAGNAFITEFRSLPSAKQAVVTVYRMHRGDLGGTDEKVVLFKGAIRNVSFIKDGREAVVQCVSLLTKFNRPIPPRTFQGLCNVMLFSQLCTLDQDDVNFRFDSTVTAVSGDQITVTGAGAFDALPDFFEAGYAEVDNDWRTITSQSGNNLILLAPFLVSPLNKSIILRAGCKRRFDTDCDNKFNNVINFQGSPYVSPNNPFQSGIDTR